MGRAHAARAAEPLPSEPSRAATPAASHQPHFLAAAPAVHGRLPTHGHGLRVRAVLRRRLPSRRGPGRRVLHLQRMAHRRHHRRRGHRLGVHRLAARSPRRSLLLEARHDEPAAARRPPAALLQRGRVVLRAARPPGKEARAREREGESVAPHVLRPPHVPLRQPRFGAPLEFALVHPSRAALLALACGSASGCSTRRCYG